MITTFDRVKWLYGVEQTSKWVTPYIKHIIIISQRSLKYVYRKVSVSKSK